MLKLLRSRGGSIRTAVILLAVLGIIGAAAGILVDRVRGPQWNSSVNVLIQSSPGSVVSLLLTGQAAAVSTADQVDAATLAVSQEVLTHAAEKLNTGGDWTQLAGSVTAEPVASSHVISITATATDATTASQISDAVAASFAEVSKTQLDSAADALASSSTNAADADLQRRAEILVQTLQPTQVFRTDQPTQTAPSFQTPAALGVVGLAAGALMILALGLLRPRIWRSSEAQRLTSIPALEFDTAKPGLGVTQLVRQLQERSNGALLICPVDPSAENIAIRFADWIRQTNSVDSPKSVPAMAEVPDRGGSGDYQLSKHAGESAEWKNVGAHSSAGVIVLAAPAESVLEVSPTTSEPSAILLVVPAGTSRPALAGAVSILARWRPVDAVVVAK